MVHTARRIISLIALMLLCAACRVDVNVNVAVQPNGSGVVTITAVADAAVVQEAPDLAADLRFDDLRAAGWTVTGPTPEPNGGLRVVLSQAFSTPAQATQILAGINGPSGPLSGITLVRQHAGAVTTFHLDGRLQISGGIAAYTDEALLAAVGATPYATDLANAQVNPADAVGINFTATLPGSVRNTTGADETGVLSWTVPNDGTAINLGTVTEVRAPSNRWAGPVATGAMILLLVWLAISVSFIGYVLVVNWRRAARRAAR